MDVEEIHTRKSYVLFFLSGWGAARWRLHNPVLMLSIMPIPMLWPANFADLALQKLAETETAIPSLMAGSMALSTRYFSMGVIMGAIAGSSNWKDPGLSVSEINRWNRQNVMGNVMLEADGDLFVDLVINMDFGITRRNLEDSIDWFAFILRQVQDDLL